MNLQHQSIHELLTSVASKTPTPGGGAVASIVAALAAALGQMVVNYSVGKKSLASHDALHADSLSKLRRLADEAIGLAEADAHAYAKLNDLLKLDPTDERRRREFASALDAAIAAPRSVMDISLQELGVIEELIGKSNAMLKSDLAIAAVLADAAARSAAWNVRINLQAVEDEAHRQALSKSLRRDLDEASRLCRHIEIACAA